MKDSGTDRVIPLDGGRFVRSKRAIVRGDEIVSLSPNEVKLLLYLVDHTGEELTYQRLLTEVWGYREGVESRTVYSTVNRLRAKIERDASTPRHLLAVPGVGYRFVLHEQPLPIQAAPEPGSGTFVGRADEIARLMALIEAERLLVLLGAGGVGKTRLARELCGRLGHRLPGGIIDVDLGEARDDDGLLVALMLALGLRGTRDRRPMIGHALADRGRCIVWLDEAEHLAGQMAAISELRAHAPEVTWLITSRIPTEIDSETLFAVDPLPDSDAAELLLLQGRIARPSLQDDEHLRALCTALDGIPLAIELAAARLGLLAPADLEARLRSDLSVLRKRRTSGDRHDSLTATLQQSWEILGAPARWTLAHASVFAGDFDLQAAEAVLEPGDASDRPDGLDVIESLDELVECGLLRAVPGEASRFALLATVRTFAARMLADPERFGPEAQLQAERRHGEHYATYGDEDPARPERSSLRAEGLQMLERERANLEAATERALARGDAEQAARAGFALLRIWQQRMPERVTLALCERILALRPEGMLWSRIAHIRGVLLWSAGRLAEAEEQYREALTRATSPVNEALTHSALGLVLRHLGRNGEEIVEHERAVVLLRGVGNVERLSRALIHLGSAYGEAERMEDAEKVYNEALSIVRGSETPRYEASVRYALVTLMAQTDRPTEALAHATRAVALAERSGEEQEILVARLQFVQAALCNGRIEEVLSAANDVITRARALGAPAREGWAHLYTSQALLAAGRYDEAVLSGFASMDSLQVANQIAVRGWATAITALSLWRLGRLREAERTAEEAIAQLEGRDPQIHGLALAIRAAARISRESDGGIDEELAHAERLTHGAVRWTLRAMVAGFAGIVAAERGQIEAARALRDEVEALIRSHGWEPPGGLDVVMKVLRQKTR